MLAYRGIRNGSIILYDPITKTQEPPIPSLSLPILPKGTCIVHERFTPEEIHHYRRMGVDLVMAHPEVSPAVAKEADFVGGTGKMIEYMRTTNAKKPLIITECNLIKPLRDAFPEIPGEREYMTPCKICPYMRKISPDALITSLETGRYEVNVDPANAAGARRSLDRMFELMQSA